MKKKYKISAVIASLALITVLLASCSVGTKSTQTTNADNTSTVLSVEDVSVNSDGATAITLNNNYVSVSGSGAKAENSTVLITSAGTYTVSGTLDDGNIIVDSEDDVTIILDNANITCSYSSAVYVYNAKSVTLYLKDGTENSLSDGSAYTYNDSYSSEADEEPNACLYSKDDLIIAGSGSLTVNGNYSNGITSTDTLLIENVTLTVKAKNTGIKGKDDLTVKSGTYNLECDGDTLHGDNNVTILDGTYTLTSGDDGIHGDNTVTINNGTFTISAHEAIEGTIVVINDGTVNISASDDGINAAQKIDSVTPSVEINGGEITINMAQGDTDAIDSNGNIKINGGTVNITAQSAFDWDGTAEISGGTVYVNGTKVTELTNQFGGGMGGMGGQPPRDGEMMTQDGEMMTQNGQPPQGKGGPGAHN